MNLRKTITGLFLGVAMAASALPVDPRPQQVRLADGSEITITMVGDEHGSWAVDAEGKALKFDALKKVYDYMSDAELRLAEQQRLDHIKRFPLPNVPKVPFTASVTGKRKATAGLKTNEYPTIGERHSLVILVEFQDQKFESVSDPKEYYTRLLNEPGFSDNDAIGSARDFYIASSDSIFVPTFDVVGPIMLPQKMAYYGSNAGGQSDAYVGRICYDAAIVADSLGLVDFSKYDLDENGKVDNIFIFYAGYGNADAGPDYSDTVWPHSTDLSGHDEFDPLFLQGKQICSYACCNEIRYNKDTTIKKPTGIGTFVHEFGHTLGLPDLYSTVYSPLVHHPNIWTTMASGSYNNNMNTPPVFSAYERFSLGWLQPKVLTTDADSLLTLEPLTKKADAYLVEVADKEEEYFFYENRQPYMWDASLPNHGMLIWHIDYDEDKWQHNSVNNDGFHQYIDIVEADGKADTSTFPGDTFPGAANVTEKELYSWNGDIIPQSPCFVRENDELVSFLMLHPTFKVAAPEAKVTECSAHTITVNWTPVKAATTYKLTVNGVETIVDGSETQHTFTGLDAETSYTIGVAAAVGYNESPSVVLEHTTDVLPFHERQPQAVTTLDIASRSFTCQWDAVADADDYVIDVFSTGYGNSVAAMGYDFSQKETGLPAGWETTSTTYYAVNGYYGNASPSLRMSRDLDYLVLSYPEKKIAKVSLWTRSQKSQGQLVAQVADENGEWKDAETKDLSADAITLTFGFDAPQAAVRLLYKRDGGFVCLDDIVTEVVSLERIPAQGYTTTMEKGAEKVKATVNGLAPETSYSFTVTALCNGTRSVASAEQTLVTAEATDEPQTSQAEPLFAYAYKADDRIGFAVPMTYNLAISLNNGCAATKALDIESKKVSSVLIYPLDYTAVSNVKVWLSKELPATVDGADICIVDVDASALKSNELNEIKLPEAYSGARYAGYTFNINKVENDADTNAAPLCTTYKVCGEGAAWIADVSGDKLTWFDYTDIFGSLVMGVRLSGEFNNDGGTIVSVADSRGVMGGEAILKPTLLNMGVAPIASVSYSVDGEAALTYKLPEPAGYGLLQPVELNVPFKAPAEAGAHKGSITLLGVNGTKVEDKSADFNFIAVTQNIRKNVLEEEFTGNTCGNCPRGIKAMEITEERYPEAVLVAIHSYSNMDPLFVSYPYSANAYPACFVDRHEEIDPYYGFADLSQASPSKSYGMDKYFDIDTNFADMGVELDGVWSEDGKSLVVKAVTNVAAPVADGKYRLEFVIVGDSLHSDNAMWRQTNYFSGNTNYLEDPNLKEYVELPYYLVDMPYRHVALEWYGGGNEYLVQDLSIGASNELVAKLDFADSKFCKYPQNYGLDYKKTSLVAILVKDNGTKMGEVVNAAKCSLSASSPSVDGIADVQLAPSSEDSRMFNAFGQRIAMPNRGLNIQNGRKFVVK